VSDRFRRVDTRIEGLVLIEPTVHPDDRGFFFETYRRNEYEPLGIDVEFVQDNHSRSVRGTIRALHFQVSPGQAKLIRAARGSVYDVAVDLRSGSPIFVPVGFAHGFCVTSEIADVTYKVSSYYDPPTERGIKFDDPAIGIPWPTAEPLVSDRDRQNPTLGAITPELPW
jgi:dTDP-4-dehydrorhamnose 3,5-epimerase